MTYVPATESFEGRTSARLGALAAAMVRHVRLVGYVLAALTAAVVLGSVAPLGTWLLLCGAVAVPTLASVLLVAGE
jgi:hypothetical protein